MSKKKLTKLILITGATGLIGSNLLELFINRSDYTLLLFVRRKGRVTAKQRIVELLKDLNFFGSREKILKRLIIIEGDLSSQNFNSDKNELYKYKNQILEVFHSAALAEFRMPLGLVRKENVFGTKNLFAFARLCPQLEKFNYVSTAFLAGNYNGIFKENDYDVGQGFNNTYEQSKFEAEGFLRRQKRYSFKLNIFRPSIVVGKFKNGRTNNFRMFYQPFRSISLGFFKAIPIYRSTYLNLISCDTVAEIIFLLSQNYQDEKTYHVVSLQSVNIMTLMKVAKNFFKYKEPRYVTPKKFSTRELSPVKRIMLEPYIPYFTFKTRFDPSLTMSRLSEIGYVYPKIDNSFLTRMFSYSAKMQYIKIQK